MGNGNGREKYGGNQYRQNQLCPKAERTDRKEEFIYRRRNEIIKKNKIMNPGEARPCRTISTSPANTYIMINPTETAQYKIPKLWVQSTFAEFGGWGQYKSLYT